MGPPDLSTVLSQRVVRGLAAFAAMVAMGTAGFMAIEGWSLLDALYMTVTTITTVGFREVRPLSTEGRVFTIGLVLFGVGTAFYILTAMVAAIIEGDLRQVFGARRVRMAIERLQGHYIICGFGRVGREIARELRERNVPFVIVDRDAAVVQEAQAAGMLAMAGDATDDDVLRAAGVGRCHALIAATDSDAGNTYITLTAKGLRPDVFVVARMGTPGVEGKLRQAGADRIVSPYAIGGRRMALAALQPIITDFIDLFPSEALGERLLAEVAVDEASGLEGRDVGEALGGLKDVVVLAVRDARGELKVGPPRSTRLSRGDILVVIGEEDDLRSLGAVARR